MYQNRPLRKEIIEAWNRLVNHACTIEDLTLLLDSVKRGEDFREFDEVFDRVWNETLIDKPEMTEDRREMYRKKAVQLLAEYQNKLEMQKMQTIQPSSRNKTVRFLKTWYAAAAAAILLGLLIPTVTHLYMKPKTEQTILYVEEVTQRGEIKTVVLPDQTEVTLNAGSRIIYPDNFAGNERSVELYGEALFDVTSDPARPFTVKTENLNIKVVGTVFDVKEYADDLTASVSVTSGKVQVETCHAASVMLEKNQQVKMNKATENFEKMTFDSDKHLLWTDGTLYFNRTPIHEVVNILNRQYPHVDIVLAKGEYSYLISGEHKIEYPVEDILESIVYSTGLEYKKSGANKYILIKN